MPKVSIASVEKAPLVASPAGALGAVETRAIFDRDRDPIQLHWHRLGAGASIRFSGVPTDRLLYVLEGVIDAGGALLEARSSAIVEYGAALAVTGRSEGTSLLEFNLKERVAQERAGGHVHLLPNERVPRVASVKGSQVGMSLHADAQCPTCRLWLHENDYITADKETVLHYHTEDEVMFVRAGSIRLGNRILGPGTALAIAANTKYGFFSGPDGLSFVNFRGSAPTYVTADGVTVLDEATLWHAATGKPEYLEPTPGTTSSISSH